MYDTLQDNEHPLEEEVLLAHWVLTGSVVCMKAFPEGGRRDGMGMLTVLIDDDATSLATTSLQHRTHRTSHKPNHHPGDVPHLFLFIP